MRQLRQLNRAPSLVSPLLRDDLIIGTFTRPYTSNNTFVYAKSGCAMTRRHTVNKKSSQCVKAASFESVQQIYLQYVHAAELVFPCSFVRQRTYIYFIDSLYLLIHGVNVYSMHQFKNNPTQHTSLYSSDMLI